MNLKTRSQVCLSLAVLGALVSQPMSAYAQSQLAPLFANAEPRLRDRMFMRLDYIRANVKTTSSEVQDVGGPVVGANDFATYLGTAATAPFLTSTQRSSYRLTIQNLFNTGIANDVAAGYTCEASGLATPCGTRARADAMVGTPAISVGYFLDDDHTWAVEGFVLAKPIDVTIKGDGPNDLNGKDIIKLKMLPPVIKLGRYFGSRGDTIRPYAGLLGSYAIFYGTKATSTLNNYVGGQSADDTTVGVKNAFGWGWMLGARTDVTDDWHVAFNVGKIRYKTEATLVTHNTVITGDSAVLQNYGPNVQEAILGGNSVITHGVGGTTQIMCDLARAKYGNTSCNHGSFTRKASSVLDTTMFVLSVGRTF